MEIKPYKYRVFDLDFSAPVEVYRNVNRKGVSYSIRQSGYVVAHGTDIHLVNAEFVVQEGGRKRVKKSGKKNVHAWVRGEIVQAQPVDEDDRTYQIEYNPKKNKAFMRKDTKKEIKAAPYVMLTSKGVYGNNSVNL
jgi:hypothetical protein